MKGNDYGFFFRFLNKAKIPYLKSDIEDAIAEHPHSPSLKSYADILTDLNVENMAVRLEKEDLFEIDEFPVIVHLNIQQGDFALLEKVSRDQGVTYYFGDKIVKESLESFEKKWSRAALLLSTPKDRAKTTNAFWLKKYTNEIFIGAGILLLFFAMLNPFVNGNIEDGIFYVMFVGLSTVGLLFSYRLLQTHLNRSARSEKYCKKSKNVDCEAVIFSKWGQLFGLFNLSHVGIVYFSGSLLAILLSATTNNLSLLTLLTICASLSGIFTVYSIALQAFVIKKWCTLCLFCQAVILGTIGLLISFNQYEFSNWYMSLEAIVLLSISFAIPIIVLTLTLAKETAIKKRRNEQVTLARLKGDKTLFKFLQLRERKAPPIDEIPQLILFGNPHAENQLLMVASLFCGPCRGKYNELFELTKNNPKKVGLTVIFTASDEFDHELVIVNKIMISLSKIGDPELVHKAISKWYDTLGSEQRRAEWIKEHKVLVKQSEEELKRVLISYFQWGKMAKITKTPTIYLNRTQVPELFNTAKNLRFIVE